jgi:hypothetical protein
MGILGFQRWLAETFPGVRAEVPMRPATEGRPGGPDLGTVGVACFDLNGKRSRLP